MKRIMDSISFYLKKFNLILLTIYMSVVTICFLFAYREVTSTLTGKETTIINMERDSILLDRIVWGYKKDAKFRIKNIGKYPLLIKDYKTTCGCTQVFWDKKPINPGKYCNIFIIFEATTIGEFVKTIDIICNIKKTKYQLKNSGEVLKPST